MRVDDFALVRGATEPITSKQTAERVWEPRFLKGRLKAVRGVLGDLPVSVLERPEEIQRFKAGLPPGARNRHGQPRAQYASRRDQLGTIPGSAASDELSVPPLRDHDSHQGGNDARSPNRT
jgi:hypothetical protein